jgi:hypothetical protein
MHEHAAASSSSPDTSKFNSYVVVALLVPSFWIAKARGDHRYVSAIIVIASAAILFGLVVSTMEWVKRSRHPLSYRTIARSEFTAYSFGRMIPPVTLFLCVNEVLLLLELTGRRGNVYADVLQWAPVVWLSGLLVSIGVQGLARRRS